MVFSFHFSKFALHQLDFGTIHILCKHIFRLFEPPPPFLYRHIESKQKLSFSNPPPPSKCFRNIWMVPFLNKWQIFFLLNTLFKHLYWTYTGQNMSVKCFDVKFVPQFFLAVFAKFLNSDFAQFIGDSLTWPRNVPEIDEWIWLILTIFRI